MGMLIWLEGSLLSTWLRESPSLWAFPFVLFLHTLGLALLVGIGVVVNLCALGFAPLARLDPIDRFYPLAWIGFWINTVSGILLLIAYPTKALTNPVFYLKLALIAIAIVSLQWLRSAMVAAGGPAGVQNGSRMRAVSWLTLLLWAGAILAGRFLAYTYNFLMASELLA